MAFCWIHPKFVGQLPYLIASRVPAYLTNWALCPYGKLPESCTLNPSQYPSINRLQYAPPPSNNLAMPTHNFYRENWLKLTILGIKPFQINEGAPIWICQWVVL